MLGKMTTDLALAKVSIVVTATTQIISPDETAQEDQPQKPGRRKDGLAPGRSTALGKKFKTLDAVVWCGALRDDLMKQTGTGEFLVDRIIETRDEAPSVSEGLARRPLCSGHTRPKADQKTGGDANVALETQGGIG
jgi:hypothetical protein